MTIPDSRRREIVATARRFKLPIVEDDAYGFIPERGRGHAPFVAIAPDLTWHVAGLAKCIGAGLRAAYVVVPDTRSAWTFASALRSATVMASPLTGDVLLRGHHAFSEPRQRCADISCERLRAWT